MPFHICTGSFSLQNKLPWVYLYEVFKIYEKMASDRNNGKCIHIKVAIDSLSNCRLYTQANSPWTALDKC